MFAIDADSVEAQIQIEIDPMTDATSFAWIIPVTGVPTFAVGSQALFTRVSDSTVPSYGFAQQFGSCCSNIDDDDDDDDGDGDGADDDGVDGTGGDDGGTDVLLEETVGAFDVVVLESATAADLMQWLDENGYYQDPLAEPILEQYVEEGFHFVALRLSKGADTAEVHPLAIRYAGTEPCIPIRLTSIAAKEDMAIRAFFLASDRYAPTNYRHVELNPLRIDWTALGANYGEVLTLAVDEPMADGHAFVTEYAGASSIVSVAGLVSDSWDANAFATAEPVAVVDMLIGQGLVVGCDMFECLYGHPLVRGLLLEFLPPPADLPEGTFWGDLAGYSDRIDTTAWDGAAFAETMTERLVLPGAHAVQLLETHPYLTRLATTISPHEMTADPLFHPTSALPDVPRLSRIASWYVPCEPGASEISGVGDFGTILLSGGWPFDDETMPAALRVESIPPAGAPMTLVDNRDLAESLLASWNGTQTPEGPCVDDDDDDDDGSTTDGAAAAPEMVGCGCMASPRGAAAGVFSMLVLFVARRRIRAGR